MKKRDLTIERGRGMTYANTDFTVYSHSTYPRGSVLSGQPRRTWLDSFSTIEEARAAYPTAQVLCDGGTTYHEPDLSHLPEDEDY